MERLEVGGDGIKAQARPGEHVDAARLPEAADTIFQAEPGSQAIERLHQRRLVGMERKHPRGEDQDHRGNGSAERRRRPAEPPQRTLRQMRERHAAEEGRAEDRAEEQRILIVHRPPVIFQLGEAGDPHDDNAERAAHRRDRQEKHSERKPPRRFGHLANCARCTTCRRTR